jgi:penicillin V acylase-like amidase (Ntn superfamily)
MGTKLYAMPKGVERQGMTDANPMTWTSKYGSVVAVVWGSATADGMNEAGLVANLLYLAGTKYGDRDAALGGITQVKESEICAHACYGQPTANRFLSEETGIGPMWW